MFSKYFVLPFVEDSILGPGENLEIPPPLRWCERRFKRKHKFNRNIRNGKGHVQIFPTKGNPTMLPRKIVFHGVPFSQKRWCCAIGAKLDKYLARIVLIATPTPK